MTDKPQEKRKPKKLPIRYGRTVVAPPYSEQGRKNWDNIFGAKKSA
jgi:hypothetical protein